MVWLVVNSAYLYSIIVFSVIAVVPWLKVSVIVVTVSLFKLASSIQVDGAGVDIVSVSGLFG